VPFMRQCGKCGAARRATNDVTIWRIRVAYWISKATRENTHAQAHAPGHPHACRRALTHARTHTHTHIDKYITFIAFSRQQFLREHASILCCTYIACLAFCLFSFLQIILVLFH
jgi:hypothetical protein